MKVPTYKRQLQRTDRTGAGMLSAQLDTNVMMLPGQGLQKFGSDLANFGSELAEVNLKKQQLANKNEAALAVQNFDTFIKSIRLEADKLTNPHEADAFFNDKVGNEYNRYLKTLSPGALEIFKIDGQKVASDLSYDFFKVNNPKILKHTKELASNEVARTLDVVGNTDMPFSVRMNELFRVIGGKIKDTSNFNFTPIPKEFNESYGIGEQDSNLIMYHRQTITNGTFIDNEDTGEITTIYIRGIKNPEEGADSPIYAVPGYFDGRKDWSEEEVVEKAIEEGWFDLYPSDNTEAGHKRRVGKLKKIINKDGETLQKIEKTIQLGINGNLYPDIIDYNEFQNLNIEALETATSNTLSSLMHKYEDAQHVLIDLLEGNIKDPVLNFAWEKLPEDKKNAVFEKAKKTADNIENLKKEELKEENELIKKEREEIKIKLWNEQNPIVARDYFDFLISIDGFDSDTQRQSAKDLVERLENDEPAFSFRSATEGSDGMAILSLETHYDAKTLTMEIVADVAQQGLLTQADFIHFRGKVDTLENDAVKFANKQFKVDYGYTESIDINSDLGKVVHAAYQQSSSKLLAWVNQNRDATYDDIIDKAQELYNQNSAVFVQQLQKVRVQGLRVYNTYINVDITSLTNEEILTAANDELAKGEMDSTDYQVLVDFVNYYVLREIDKR